MNLLYPEMDSPSGPSIMGSENPKFSERRNGQSDSDSISESQTPMDGSNTTIRDSRKSRDGLSREERMKLVRERQMGEHKRRLDELRQAQIQAMKAKQQQDEERRRRLEEIKNRDEQKRAAVDARRKRLEDEERDRCEAIIRKHQEIFNKIDAKKRHHESRKMAYGLSTYQLSDQDSAAYTSGNQTSRRAMSASVLFRRGNVTSRSYHQNSLFSPGSSSGQSARLRPSPSTPSRNGGGYFDSMSGSKTTSSENSPVHSGRQHQHHRIAQSHPPPVSRNRVPETARSRQGSRPQTAQVVAIAQSARAKRPTSLMTRSNGVEKQQEKVATTPDPSFRTMSKRSQSVGNVSARNRSVKQSAAVTLKPAGSQREVYTPSPRKVEEVGQIQDLPDRRSPEPTLTRTGRKLLISEAEAKAALAEKRRQARHKVEFERTQQEDNISDAQPTIVSDSPPPSTLGVESPSRELTLRRESEIEFLELERSFTEESRPMESSVLSQVLPSSGKVSVVSKNESIPDHVSSLSEEETVGSGILRNGGGESPEVINEISEIVVGDAESFEVGPEIQDVSVEHAVELKEDERVVSVILEEPIVPDVAFDQKEEFSETRVNPDVSPTTVKEDTLVSIPAPSAVDTARAESDRRRLETEQREEEERNARRQRLEAIKRLTKSGNGPSSNFSGSTERLASPVTETAKPIDALENARKLLQRRGLGGGGVMDTSSLVSSPSTGSLKGLVSTPLLEQAQEAKLNGDFHLNETRQNGTEETRSASGTPFSEVSSTDTVSLGGYIRSQDEDGQQNGKTIERNGASSGMSESSSTDFDPYSPKEETWKHVNGNNVRPDLWNGSSMQLTGIVSGNTDLLLNFDDH